MNERRFLNQYQPQTLVMGTLLCYVQAFFAVLSLSPLGLLIAVALGFGAYGIANEKKWGYGLATGAAVLIVALVLIFAGADVLTFPLVLTFMFQVALVCLLLHPQSREYQRIWFS
ncbi:MAG: hypothetical protein WD598_00345 [Acidimicrobiia bacterium]